MVDQRLMRLAAEKQAVELSERTGLACYVYRRVGYPTLEEVTWYVRTGQEPEPEGSVMEFVAKR